LAKAGRLSLLRPTWRRAITFKEIEAASGVEAYDVK